MSKNRMRRLVPKGILPSLLDEPKNGLAISRQAMLLKRNAANWNHGAWPHIADRSPVGDKKNNCWILNSMDFKGASNISQAPLILFDSDCQLAAICFDHRRTTAQLIAALDALVDRLGPPNVIVVDLGKNSFPKTLEQWALENFIMVSVTTQWPVTAFRLRAQIERIVKSQVRITC